MNEFTNLIFLNILEFAASIVVFAVLVFVGKHMWDYVGNLSFIKSSRFSNPKEYLPDEELSSINQVFYLAMVLILVIALLYTFFNWGRVSNTLLVADIILSLYLAIQVKGNSLKDKCLLFLLVPFGSFSYLVSVVSFVGFLDILHGLVFIYFMKQYYQKFFEYTEENRLGITILLLFSIVFISFFITIFVENVVPIDSIVMVSNAFTSNGYAILGKTVIGKVNALFLVWAGFILSGVGTATLTVAIVVDSVNEKFDRLEELARKNKKE